MACADDDAEAKRPRRITREVAAVAHLVHQFFQADKCQDIDISVCNVLGRAAAATGLSQSSLKKIAREGIDSFTSAADPESRERESLVPASWRATIRKCVSDKYLARQKVTLDTLLATLRADPVDLHDTLFVWTRVTLWRTLQSMGFCCKAGSSHYMRLHEKSSVVGQRLKYIREIQELRDQGYDIFYQDETWFNKNMVPEKQWLDVDGKGGRHAPSGKGSRFIVSHVGSRLTGLLPGCDLCIAVDYNKESDDYHQSMNWEMFKQWICDSVLPTLSRDHPHSVLVLDQATYHRVLSDDTKPVWKKMNKADIIAFLQARGVPADELPPLTKMTVVELRELAATVVGEGKYEIVRLAAEQGIKVVFLPVAHPELNPIETVWGMVKNIVRSRNGVEGDTAFTMANLRSHINFALSQAGPGLWKRAEDACIAQEMKYLELADRDDEGSADEDDDEEDVDGLASD